MDSIKWRKILKNNEAKLIDYIKQREYNKQQVEIKELKNEIVN